MKFENIEQQMREAEYDRAYIKRGKEILARMLYEAGRIERMGYKPTFYLSSGLFYEIALAFRGEIQRNNNEVWDTYTISGYRMEVVSTTEELAVVGINVLDGETLR